MSQRIGFGPQPSVKNGFPTRLNSREVEVEQKMMGKETVKVKLSSRAVVKEQGLRDVCLHKRRCTQIETQLERQLSPEQDADNRGRCVGRVKRESKSLSRAPASEATIDEWDQSSEAPARVQEWIQDL